MFLFYFDLTSNVLLTFTDTSLLFQRKSMSASKELDSFGDREIRDIASQIMVGSLFVLDHILTVCYRGLPCLTRGPVCVVDARCERVPAV